MNLKLEELRKRLLEPLPAPSSGNTVYRRSSNEIYSNPLPMVQQPIERAVEQESGGITIGVPLVEPSASPSTTTEEPPSSVTSAVLQYVEQAAVSAPEEEVMEAKSQYQLAHAVAKVFEQTKAFQDRFAELAKMFAPIERASQAAVRSFEPLRNFEEQIFQLARSFEPMRTFQSQLAELAQTFEPMKGLQQQLVQLSQAFQVHLGRLSKSLEPAREFQLELLKLARAFDSATDLQNQFEQLAETFKVGALPAVQGASAAPLVTQG